MPLEQTITVVNNSGKIISTGKQLLSIFKEARGAYHDKKSQLRSERAPIRRSQTFDPARGAYRGHVERDVYEPEPDRVEARGYYYKYDDPRDYDYEYGNGLAADYYSRRRSVDAPSETSSRRSHRSSHSSRHGRHHGHRHGHQQPRSLPALTENNLKTLSEVSSTPPSKAPPPPAAYRSPYAETMPLDVAMSRMDLRRPEMRSLVAETEHRRMQPPLVPRRCSEPAVAMVGNGGGGKEVDMNLAYGNIPPDLATRVDLDPDDGHEREANQLIHKVENLLDEAHCVQHSATAIIKHLQEKPDAAAAVALALAELSSAIGNMSPAFLGFLKGGSPAVFALLASPQFLIGTSIAAGLTVVIFGGWKIVKKVQEAQAARETIASHAAADAAAAAAAAADYAQQQQQQPPPLADMGAGVDEALVVDEELSSIESWRRGIMPFGADDESADVELITPVADRAHREKYAKDDVESDLRSRRSSARTHKSGKTHRTSHRDRGPADKERDGERRSAKAESVSGRSDRSKKSSSSAAAAASASGRHRERRAIEDGRSRRGADDDGLDATFRPKARRDNMLKAIFKKKDRSELVLA